MQTVRVIRRLLQSARSEARKSVTEGPTIFVGLSIFHSLFELTTISTPKKRPPLREVFGSLKELIKQEKQ
jgi:hypothetical protein